MSIKSEKIRKIVVPALALMMATTSVAPGFGGLYSASATSTSNIQDASTIDSSESSIKLGEFDYANRKFKNITGVGTKTYKNIVIYYPANKITNLDTAIENSGFNKSDNSTDATTILTKDGGATPGEIATILNGLIFDLSYDSNNDASGTFAFRVELNNEISTNKTGYLGQNQHFYQYIDGKKSWFEAYNDAKSKTYNGMKGYLATITSEDEEKLIKSMVKISDDYTKVWIGGTSIPKPTDNGSEKKIETYFYDFGDGSSYDINNNKDQAKGWYWACGPEIGQYFTNGTKHDANGYSNIGYTKWDNGEPNGEGDERYLSIRKSGGNYLWNNIDKEYTDSNDNPAGYIVEYGGIDNDAPSAPSDMVHDEVTLNLHKMVWSFKKTANAITAIYDTNTPGYYGNDKKQSYTIAVNAPNKYYTGKEYDALKVELKNHEGTGTLNTIEDLRGKYSVEYISEDGKKSASAPKEIGNYTLALTLKPGESSGPSETLNVNFRILPSPVFIPDGFGKEEIPTNITSADIDKVRAAGADRIDTAINISKAFYQKADNVVVANAWNFPDALSASVLANILKAPILLNGAKTLDTRVNAEITRLGVKDAVVVGGENSIAKAVKNSLNVFDKNGTQRISGDNRYATSAKIAEEIFKATKKSDTVVIASGENFADSLSAAGFASKNGYPILLVKKNTVPSEITNILKKYNVKNTIIVGGTGSVSDQVAKEIKAIAPNQERIAGKDRYGTSVQVAKLKMSDTDKAFIASGKNFADALVVGAIAGANNQSVILVSDKGDNKAAKDYLKANIKKVNVIGGEDTVPTSLVINLLK